MLTINIVQQSAWDIPMDSVPLAAGYLKAVLDSDEEFGHEVDVTIRNFRGGMSLTEMARELFLDRVPDVLAMSVLGWNYRNFACLAESYKQLRPDGLVVFGGNHVAGQAERVFREEPAVDIVVNGEGERTFRELVAHLLSGAGGYDAAAGPDNVPGLSYRAPDGTVRTTPDAERIADLDTIPSPFLTGAIPMTDAAGRFGYEFALMETNRGCPYKCAFCYWGGAVGQRVRAFSRERLAAELDYFGFYQVPTVFLCDANFGMLEADEVFVEDLIRTQEKYGYPRALEANWAKNKSARFHRIVQTLKERGFKSSFTLALQTLTDEALTLMQRRNMRVNEWEGLVDWLSEQGLSCYAELIWGTPGDTAATFLEGYDRLAQRVPRIAVYPLLLLPNTAYFEQRDAHGFTTIRGHDDDFEYVLASRTAPIDEHLRMHRFMYLARLLGENQYFKRLWAPARILAGMSQSQVIMSLLDRFDASDDPSVAAFRDSFPVLAESPAVARGHRMLYSGPEIDREIERWWRETVVAAFPPAWREFGEQLYRYERWSRPVYRPPGAPVPPGWELVGGEYVSEPLTLSYDMEEALRQLLEEPASPPAPAPITYEFRAPPGFHDHLDNHETGAHYYARAVVIDRADGAALPVGAPEPTAG